MQHSQHSLFSLLVLATPIWAGFPLSDGFAEASGFVGWLYPLNDFVYLLSLNAWAYLPEDSVSLHGAWAYLFF